MTKQNHQRSRPAASGIHPLAANGSAKPPHWLFAAAFDNGEHGCSKILAGICGLCDAHYRYMVSAIGSCSWDCYGWPADHFCHMPLSVPTCTPKTSCSIWCCRTTYSRHHMASAVVFNRFMMIGLGMLAEQLCRSCCARW